MIYPLSVENIYTDSNYNIFWQINVGKSLVYICRVREKIANPCNLNN